MKKRKIILAICSVTLVAVILTVGIKFILNERRKTSIKQKLLFLAQTELSNFSAEHMDEYTECRLDQPEKYDLNDLNKRYSLTIPVIARGKGNGLPYKGEVMSLLLGNDPLDFHYGGDSSVDLYIDTEDKSVEEYMEKWGKIEEEPYKKIRELFLDLKFGYIYDTFAGPLGSIISFESFGKVDKAGTGIHSLKGGSYKMYYLSFDYSRVKSKHMQVAILMKNGEVYMCLYDLTTSDFEEALVPDVDTYLDVDLINADEDKIWEVSTTELDIAIAERYKEKRK